MLLKSRTNHSYDPLSADNTTVFTDFLYGCSYFHGVISPLGIWVIKKLNKSNSLYSSFFF